MQENGQRLDNFEEIKQATKRHFEALYTEETPPKKKANLHQCNVRKHPAFDLGGREQFFVAGN